MPAPTPTYWLPKLFAKFYNAITLLGVPLPQQPVLDFGAGFTVTDDPANLRTRVVYSGSSAIPVPQDLAFSDSGTSIAISQAGEEQLVCIDQAGGQGTYPMPTGCVDGQVVRVSDTRNVGTGLATWGPAPLLPPLLSVGTGVYLENPMDLGTFATGTTVAMPQIAGNCVVYVWRLPINTWKIQ